MPNEVPGPGTPSSNERNSADIVRFAPETSRSLIDMGYAIYPLGRKSLRWHRNAGYPVRSSLYLDFPALEELQSRSSEVAINPSRLFLPVSNRRTLEQQSEMVKSFSQELSSRWNIAGARAIIGTMPDYVELTFAHLEATGEYLFGEADGYNCARTQTPTIKEHFAVVGIFFANAGLMVDHRHAIFGDADVHAAPMILPEAA